MEIFAASMWTEQRINKETFKVQNAKNNYNVITINRYAKAIKLSS